MIIIILQTFKRFHIIYIKNDCMLFEINNFRLESKQAKQNITKKVYN